MKITPDQAAKSPDRAQGLQRVHASVSIRLPMKFDEQLAKTVFALKAGTQIRAIGLIGDLLTGFLMLEHSIIVSHKQ